MPKVNNMNTNLSVLWSNPHLRYAAIGIAGLEIAAVWLPMWKAQIDATQKIVTFYAVLAAANSTPPNKTT